MGNSQPANSINLVALANETHASYMARAALCMLSGPRNDTPEKEVEKVIELLRKDPRIREIWDVKDQATETRQLSLSSAGIDKHSAYPSGLPISDIRHIHVAQTRSPLQFSVQVPRRVQAGDGNEDKIPSDTYWVAWDGVLLVVLWRHEEPGKPGALGGKIVIDILREIVRKTGQRLWIQPCGPSCNYPFAHRDILVLPLDSSSSDPTFEKTGQWQVSVNLIGETDDAQASVAKLFAQLSRTATRYAELRSDGRAIEETEKSARKDLRELLKLYNRRAEAGSPWSIKSWPDRWRMRGWRRQAARLITRLWISLATLESRRHNWNTAKYYYEGAGREDSSIIVFEPEYEDQVNAVDSIEVESIDSSVKYAASRLDTGSVVSATAAGAVAGAVIGALVAALLQFSLGSSGSGANQPSTPRSPAAHASHPSR